MLLNCYVQKCVVKNYCIIRGTADIIKVQISVNLLYFSIIPT